MLSSFRLRATGIALIACAGLGAAVQAAYVALNESGTATTMKDLCAKLVALDESTRAQPNAANHTLYTAQLERQTNLMRALQGAGWL